ncbi:MAG: D-alanyl-D-alanine carboxypeptidase/D-alanyl-D-alanine-endopeptidase [Burkholderiales bacterium]|nr:D-alanyl-D-alanine carboxypeptidase/D-alanyl-D-alanine-endopeptidase [Burkholderiales bacterium]
MLRPRLLQVFMLPLVLLALLGCLPLSSAAQGLPPEVDAALARAKVPRDAVSVLVIDALGTSAPRVAHRTSVAMNPASVMKLVTTFAALDLLGPAYTWSTPVYMEGTVREGTLYGNLYIKGQGDPKLVLERLWLLLRRVQGLGIHAIAGDIVLDRSALDVPEADPASFDGEPLRPYNAAPDALLINFKSVVMTFTPDRTANLAQVQFDPPLYGVQTQATVPLSTGDCGDYRGTLKADFSDANRIRFLGSYSASCGEKVWPVAYADPKSYGVRAVQGLWLDMGGKLSGSVRYGTVPAPIAAGKPAFEVNSAPLPEVIRDINKFSNNVMAQQLFLTLGRVLPATTPTTTLDASGPALSNGSFTASRAQVLHWWKERIATDDLPVLDNGSGLSRQERITAQALGKLLQTAYRSPVMPELMASLPISGVDGTLRRMKSRALGSAHLKTGSLSNVVALAGYVHSASGKHSVLVAIVNHPNANAARPALDALVEWTAKAP